MIDAFKIFIHEVIRPFKVPGQFDNDATFQPKLFCSVLGFLGEKNGHLVFEQGRVLNQETLPDLIESIESQINIAFEVVSHDTDEVTDSSDEGKWFIFYYFIQFVLKKFQTNKFNLVKIRTCIKLSVKHIRNRKMYFGVIFQDTNRKSYHLGSTARM